MRRQNQNIGTTTQVVYDNETPITGIEPVARQLVLPLEIGAPVPNILPTQTYVLRLRGDDSIRDDTLLAMTNYPVDAFVTNVQQANALGGARLTQEAQNQLLESVDFTNMLLAQIHPNLSRLPSPVSEIRQATNIVDWDMRVQTQIAETVNNFVSHQNASFNSLNEISPLISNMARYARSLNEHTNHLSTLDVNNIITRMSNMPLNLPTQISHAPREYDLSLFHFLESTFQNTSQFLAESLNFFTMVHPVSAISFALTLAPYYFVLSEQNLRNGPRLSIGNFYIRVRNTFIFFQSVLNSNIRNISPIIIDTGRIVEEFRRNLTGVLETVTTQHQGGSSSWLNRISNVVNFFQTNIWGRRVFALVSWSFLYLSKDQFKYLFGEILQYLRRNPEKTPQSLLSCIEYGLKVAMKLWSNNS